MCVLDTPEDEDFLEHIAMCNLSRSLRGFSKHRGWKCIGNIPLEPICDWEGVQCDGNFKVTGLYLHQMNLSGTISPRINHLHRLQVLMLSENHLQGEIPKVNLLQHLQILDLRDNELHGRPPPSIHELDNVLRVDLTGNSDLQSQPTQHRFTFGTFA